MADRGYYTLGDIAQRTPTLAVSCTRCDRSGRYHLARQIEQYGADFPGPEWLRIISADCPRRLTPSPSIYELCGVHCPEMPALFGSSSSAR